MGDFHGFSTCRPTQRKPRDLTCITAIWGHIRAYIGCSQDHPKVVIWVILGVCTHTQYHDIGDPGITHSGRPGITICRVTPRKPRDLSPVLAPRTHPWNHPILRCDSEGHMDGVISHQSDHSDMTPKWVISMDSALAGLLRGNPVI